MTDLTAQAPPLISVVIPCFNYQDYVGHAIECVLAQDYEHKELIVIDDGSSDDSASVIARYADRARVIAQPNQGHIASCNRGFAESRGELVIFLDADDLLEPDALSSVAAAWSTEFAKVQYDLKIIDAAGVDSGRRFCNFTGEYSAVRVAETFRRTGTYRWPVTVGNAYARWFLEAVFPLTIEASPDGFLNTIAPVYGKIATIPRVLASYRVHGKNRWSSHGSDHARLPERIDKRRGEVSTLREHAQRRGALVPDVNVLDHEIAFINYRLMAHRLGLDYHGRAEDTPLALATKAGRLLLFERYPARLSLAHLFWFGLLALSPRSVAEQLIELRFNRMHLKKWLASKLAHLQKGPQRAA
jgi:glycosyltransferase involved in cell wall biosynthesis